MNEMGGNLDARRKSDCGDAQPEELAPEEQNNDADQRADNRHGKFHLRKGILDSYSSDSKIGLVGFEPTASWSRTRRSTKLSHSPN